MNPRSALEGLDGAQRVLAARVLEYLRRNPNATDTIEGIARFWLSGERPTDQEMEEIMTELAGRQLVERRLKPDGEWVYRRAAGEPAAEPEGAAG